MSHKAIGNEREAVQAAATLMKLLIPANTECKVSANRVTLPGELDRPSPHWRVAATTLAGEEVVVVALDARSSALKFASHHAKADRRPRSGEINQRQAVGVSLEWLELLGASSNGTRWKLAKTPVHKVPYWVLHFSAGPMESAVTLDSRSGDLVLLRNRWRRSEDAKRR